MRFIFLQAVIAANASICCLFVTWHLFFTDEEASVSTFDAANALEQAAKFVGKALLPDGTMGIRFDEMAVFEDITSDVVNNCANDIDGIQRDWLVGRTNDAVCIFEKGASSCDVAMSWKQRGRLQINHRHKGFGYDGFDEVDALMGAMLGGCTCLSCCMRCGCNGRVIVIVDEGSFRGMMTWCGVCAWDDGMRNVLELSRIGIPYVHRLFVDSIGNGGWYWSDGRWIDGNRSGWDFSKE